MAVVWLPIRALVMTAVRAVILDSETKLSVVLRVGLPFIIDVDPAASDFASHGE
jgi:hypothetical protein